MAIRLQLKEVLEARGLTVYALARKITGDGRDNARYYRMVRNPWASISLKTLNDIVVAIDDLSPGRAPSFDELLEYGPTPGMEDTDGSNARALRELAERMFAEQANQTPPTQPTEPVSTPRPASRPRASRVRPTAT